MNLITEEDLTPQALEDVRFYLFELLKTRKISYRRLLDWLTDQYRDLNTPITDSEGNEVFLPMGVFETPENDSEPSISYWFRDFANVRKGNRSFVRREAIPRVVTLLNLLRAIDPIGTAHFGKGTIPCKSASKTNGQLGGLKLAVKSAAVSIAALLLPITESRAESNLCFEVPTEWTERGCDLFGCGHQGASRAGGTRIHKGIDYLMEQGRKLTSPVEGSITKIGYPYFDDLSFRYVEVIDKTGCTSRFFYLSPKVKVGDTIKVGDVLGTIQDLKQKHGPKMKNHLHVEMR